MLKQETIDKINEQCPLNNHYGQWKKKDQKFRKVKHHLMFSFDRKMLILFLNDAKLSILLNEYLV